MKNAIKEIFLMGVGAASVTKRKAEQALKAFIREGAITKKEANELTARMVQEGKKMQTELIKQGRNEIRRIADAVEKGGSKASKKASKTIKKVSSKLAKRVRRV